MGIGWFGAPDHIEIYVTLPSPVPARLLAFDQPPPRFCTLLFTHFAVAYQPFAMTGISS
jgi:hypothetical protein